MATFIEKMNITDQEIKNIKLHGVNAKRIRQLVIETYL